MPTLHFHNGESKSVGYAVAASIRKVKDGDFAKDEQPTPEQATYAAQVEHISYEDLPSFKHKEQFVIREHDTEMDKIFKSGLKGRDLFHAVCQRIKTRNAQM